MKLGKILVALALFTGLGSGQEESVDPFGETVTKEQEAIAAAPETWEVMCEVFSMPFGEAAKMRRDLREPGEIYAGLLKRVDQKTAALEELAILKGWVWKEAEMASIEEYIYPTEYDPPEVPNGVASVPKNRELAQMLMTPSNPTSYDLRKLGLTMKLEISGKETPDAIRAQLEVTLVTLMERDSWGRDKAKAEVPRFEVQGIAKEVILTAGKPVLVGTMSPSKNADKKERRVWFLFATVSAGGK